MAEPRCERVKNPADRQGWRGATRQHDVKFASSKQMISGHIYAGHLLPKSDASPVRNTNDIQAIGVRLREIRRLANPGLQRALNLRVGHHGRWIRCYGDRRDAEDGPRRYLRGGRAVLPEHCHHRAVRSDIELEEREQLGWDGIAPVVWPGIAPNNGHHFHAANYRPAMILHIWIRHKSPFD